MLSGAESEIIRTKSTQHRLLKTPNASQLSNVFLHGEK
jgi:hypothetical protein